MKQEGSILLSIIFVLAVSFLGFSLLSFSILHSGIRGARQEKLSRCETMYQELVYSLHRFRERAYNGEIAEFANPEVDFFNNDYFPPHYGANDHRVFIEPSFDYRVRQGLHYDVFTVMADLEVSASDNAYRWVSRVLVDFYSGEIPLSLIPFLINAPDVGSLEKFLEENPLEIIGGSASVQDASIGFSAGDFLMEALKVGGTALTWAAMREKFGLEISDSPVPEGIHRVVTGDTVSCLFIQGNVERLTFSTHDNRQTFVVVQKNIPHEFSYVPGENIFKEDLAEEPLRFLEKIVVNGNILSLEQAGDAAFKDSANIVLYASGTVAIRSDLIRETLNLQKIKSTALTLVSSFEALFNTGEPQTGITIENKNPVSLQVSLITDGKVRNESIRLKLEGGMYCKDIENNGQIEIHHRPAGSGVRDLFRTSNFKYVADFYISFIDEEAQ
ncbi:MAG: hypothetical protein GY765_44155 [bacterium]|nr:hypothetical protein [bacterium]